MAKKARIKDIAMLAGVSIGTVDRVLHNRGEVAEETRLRVLDVVKQLEYSPNLMARALKSRQEYKIVVLLPAANSENAFWYKHQQGLANAIEEMSPYQVSIESVVFDIQSSSDFKRKAEYVVNMESQGVIIAPVYKKESFNFCSELQKRQIPHLFIDSFLDNTGALSFVGEDAYQSGRIAAQLIDYGPNSTKDILIINVAKDLDNRLHLSNRTQGFLSYFMDVGHNSGLKINYEMQETKYESVKQSLDTLFEKNKNIGAIFVTSSKAYAIARYFEEKIIRNVNIVGYDIVDKNIKYLRTGYINYLLGQRPADQIHIAVKRLFEFLLSNKIPNQKEFLPIDIVSPENIAYFI